MSRAKEGELAGGIGAAERHLTAERDRERREIPLVVRPELQAPLKRCPTNGNHALRYRDELVGAADNSRSSGSVLSAFFQTSRSSP